MKKIYSKIEKELLPKKLNCQESADIASEIASMQCADLVNEMEGEDKEHRCPCSGDGDVIDDVDLIILVDGSGSLDNARASIGSAINNAIESANKNCKKNTKPWLLFVDDEDNKISSSSKDTYFTMSHENFLRKVDGYNGPFRTEVVDAVKGDQTGEEGAEAIIDLCNHHKWKKGACRAILYVSDTFFDSDVQPGRLQRSADRMNEAIAVANAKGVSISTHLLPKSAGEGYGNDYPALEGQYKNLASQTKGVSITNKAPSKPLYEELISEAICQSCENKKNCEEVDWPELAPCVHVSWGASKCDGIESHDDEVICITICNCYSNVTFKNLRIGYVLVVDDKGDLPPLLPDGSPSVHIYPTGPVCFGDIGPCKDDKETCVSRQFVLLTRGAVTGNYKLKIGGLCFDTELHHHIECTERQFKICKD